jgi:hypothetical protein
MTAFGFWVVAALSSQISGRPLTRSCRMGKSWRINRGSSGRLAMPSSAGARSGLNSTDSTPGGREVDCDAALSALGLPDEPGIGEATGGVPGNAVGRVRKSVSVTEFAGTGLAGIDEGRTGKPGGDCTPGTPGKENSSLMVGNFATEPG